MTKGPSYMEWADMVKNKTKYQYFCPKCKHGPFYTAHMETQCPACSKEIVLKMIDGDIWVNTK